MINLIIKEKGHLVEIPGMAPFRTPATIDISRIDIRKVIGHLKVNGIKNYRVVAEDGSGATEVYTDKDFSPQKKKKKTVDPYKKEIDSRFNKLEKMISMLLTKETRNDDQNKEQITEKLNELEQLSKEILKRKPEKVIYRDTKGQTWEKDKDEEVARFIPEADITDMKLTSSSVKSVKQEKDDIDDAADSLSKLLGGKK
jgi:hypothetical protein